MVLEALAEAMLGLIDWGRGIIAFLILMEIFKGIKGPSGAAAVASGIGGLGKGIGKGFQTYLNPKSKRFARRAQKREINEWILEEKEEKSLDYLKGEALRILTELEAVANRGVFSQGEHTGLVQAILGFGDRLTETKRLFRNLSKRTSRADNGLNKLFEYLKKEKMQVPEEVKALENNILLLHQQTGQEIAGVDGVYQKIINSDAMHTLESMKQEMFVNGGYQLTTDSKPFNLANLHELIKGFQNEKFLLEDAYKKQAEAKKEMTGIIQETRRLYE